MGFQKGKPRSPNAGRKKGSVNKTTKSAREAFQLAFEGTNGVDGLKTWAKANPTEFYKLYARLIPVEHVGEGGEGPIATVVKHIYEDVKK
jgi:hypothetical protein